MERAARMTQSDFDAVDQATAVNDRHGGSSGLPDRRHDEALLRQKLQELGLTSMAAYNQYLRESPGPAPLLSRLFDRVVFAKVGSADASGDFGCLGEQILPRLRDSYGAGRIRPLCVWCIGSPFGQEVFALAMMLEEFATLHPPFTYAICAIDLFNRPPETGRLGRFPAEMLTAFPACRTRYLHADPEGSSDWLIDPTLAAKIAFAPFHSLTERMGIRNPIDIIFCRHVLAPFARQLQEELLSWLCRQMRPGRFLCMGQGETMPVNLPLLEVAPAVFRKQ